MGRSANFVVSREQRNNIFFDIQSRSNAEASISITFGLYEKLE